MENTLFTINNVNVNLNNDSSLTWVSCAMIDDDGSGPSLGDPDYQNDTTLHINGVALDATVVPYIVVPPQVRDCVAPIVMGCKAFVENLSNGLSTVAVVGDIGPHTKIGEISIETANRIGVPSSPTTGGIDDHVIKYTIWPGVPAVVDGITYSLQSS